MKKITAFALSLLMLCTASLALAMEAKSITPTYEGTYIELDGFNLKISLPNEWTAYGDNPDLYLAMGNADETQFMIAELEELPGETLDTMAASLSAAEGYENVSAVYINDVPYVTYTAPAEDIFGAYLINGDSDYTLHFTFTPGSDTGLVALAEQILGSVQVVQ